MHTRHRSAPARTPTLGASATVREIRPLLGLACVEDEDEDGRAWTITRSTQGSTSTAPPPASGSG